MILSITLAVVGIVAGVVGITLWWVLFVALMANTPKEKAPVAHRWINSILGACCLCIVGGIVLLILKRPWWSAGVGAAPLIGFAATFLIYCMIDEYRRHRGI